MVEISEEMVERAARRRFQSNLNAIASACDKAADENPSNEMVPKWRQQAVDARAQRWEDQMPAHLDQLRAEIRQIVEDAVNG